MPEFAADIVKFLINPLLPAFVLLTAAIIKKRPARRLLTLLLLYLYAVCAPASSKLLGRAWSVHDTYSPAKTYDAVIALCGVADTAWYLQRQHSPIRLECYYRFGDNIERVLTALELIETGQARRLLFGDFRQESYSEAALVAEFLEKQGLPRERIVIYGETASTHDEAVKTRRYLQQHADLKQLLLVTSASHMRRAAAAFSRQGLQPDLLSVERLSGTLTIKDFLPRKGGLAGMQKMLYELAGYAGYFVFGKL